jgi:UDP-glucose 6-dehydrogenase
MQVPGSDDKFGYGGPCFPKDCNALIKYSEKIGEPFELLKKSSEINNRIRRQYDSLSKREKEQNINYNDS